MPAITVATFYKFIPLPDYAALRAPFKERMEALRLKGTILLAPEGINATLAGARQNIDAMLAYLAEDKRFTGLEIKESVCGRHPFARAKVRLKKEIITLGIPANPNEKTGTYVAPQDWNALIADECTLVLDTRNDYEIHLGQFQRAINPGTRHFRQLPERMEELEARKDQPVALYCTGGIRCEKFSAYLLAEGYTNIYQLKGGILKYLEEVPPNESLWQGTCFVFDERVGVTHGDMTQVERRGRKRHAA